MLYQSIIDAITNITILAILFFVNDTYLRKFGYIMICILLGLLARQLDVNQTLTGITNWTDYFNSIKSTPSNIIPFVILILAIPVVYFTLNRNIINGIIYGGLPIYGMLLFTVAFLFNPQAYHAFITFDDIFTEINNAVGDMAPRNVIPFYFSLFLPFMILGFVFVSNQVNILFISGLYLILVLMYIGFITYTIDYST